ncbi:MAG: flagellar brake protein [Fimbriimonadales bacterium]|nr:flagellar brake protein [Fimbriimonadales bacterium]
MTDWASVGTGLGLAMLGGLLLALASRRWSLCPLQSCPTLEAGQRIELRLADAHYTTVLTGVDGETLLITPPLRRGVPVAFELGTFAQLRTATPAGVYEATIQFTGRRMQPAPALQARLASRWAHQQRRRHERIILPDEVTVPIWIATEPWIGWARDVSAGGMRLIAPVPAPPNAQVTLELPAALRGVAETAGEMRVARVVACERAPTRHGYAYQLRLAFTDG